MTAPVATWRGVCPAGSLPLGRGVAALVDGTQLAIFRLADVPDVFVIDNVDPFTGVGCLSRGIVGDVAGELMVASPLHKQRFSLRTGQCLDDAEVAVRVYEARVRDDVLEVLVP